jgi:hypothetical protein
MKYKEASQLKKQAPSMPWNTIIKSMKSMEHVSSATNSLHTIFCHSLQNLYFLWSYSKHPVADLKNWTMPMPYSHAPRLALEPTLLSNVYGGINQPECEADDPLLHSGNKKRWSYISFPTKKFNRVMLN